MLHKIRKALITDLDILEALSARAYEKFNLSEFGQEYDCGSVIETIKGFIHSSISRVMISENKEGKVLGYIISVVVPQLYNINIKQIVDVAIQPSPFLSNMEQGRVLIALIGDQEKYAKANNIKMSAVSITKKFDISNYLRRNGYKLSDIVYVKEVL